MTLKNGILIRATRLLDDPVFKDSMVLITEYNNDGATGFVINKPLGRNLNELEEFRHSPSFPLFEGGPVDKEHLFFIHRCPDRIDDGKPVDGTLFSGGNFKQVITGINNRSIMSSDVKIFVGYCGWNAGELEAEIAEGSWEVIENGSVW